MILEYDFGCIPESRNIGLSEFTCVVSALEVRVQGLEGIRSGGQQCGFRG